MQLFRDDRRAYNDICIIILATVARNYVGETRDIIIMMEITKQTNNIFRPYITHCSCNSCNDDLYTRSTADAAHNNAIRSTRIPLGINYVYYVGTWLYCIGSGPGGLTG